MTVTDIYTSVIQLGQIVLFRDVQTRDFCFTKIGITHWQNQKMEITKLTFLSLKLKGKMEHRITTVRVLNASALAAKCYLLSSVRGQLL